MKSILLIASLSLFPIETINMDMKTDVEMQTTKVKCNKVKSATDGTTKTCFYNCGGKTRTIVVADRKACPVIR